MSTEGRSYQRSTAWRASCGAPCAAPVSTLSTVLRALCAVALLVCVGARSALLAQHGEQGRAAQAAPRFSPAPRPPAGAPQQPARGGLTAPAPRGQHLPQWMENHQNLNPQQREQALRQEPGFNRLPGQQQQQLINRLHKLDSAPPQVRQRILARNEIFERLAPEQKQQIRGASQALTQMAPERNLAVRHAFRDLRGLPPDQRRSVLDSARFQAEFSTQERSVLGNLLSIEPYQP